MRTTLLISTIVACAVSCIVRKNPVQQEKFIMLQTAKNHNPLLLIANIDKPQWKVGYRFGAVCSAEFRATEEKLKTSIIEVLRAWLKPLRDMKLGKAITDSFQLVPLEDFISWEEERRKNINGENKHLGELNMYITFSCEEGQSIARVGGIPHVFMKSAANAGTRRYFFILIHEIGHAFGMGDTYANKDRLSTGGIPRNAGKQPSAVMSYPSEANRPHYLTEDDRKGIIWLYKYYYEKQPVEDCFFPDYEFEEETGGCRPKHPLIYEVKHASARLVDIIIRSDPSIDVNARDTAGMTALHHAVLRGHVEIVKALLGHRAIKVNILSKDKHTPAQLARELKLLAIAALIEAHPTSWAVEAEGKKAVTWGELKRGKH